MWPRAVNRGISILGGTMKYVNFRSGSVWRGEPYSCTSILIGTFNRSSIVGIVCKDFREIACSLVFDSGSEYYLNGTSPSDAKEALDRFDSGECT